MEPKLYGAIEAGGTKFVCAVGTAPDNIIERAQIPTTTPAETLAAVISFFKQQPAVVTIGVGSFGPLDLDKKSSKYGYITTTPKAGWADTDIVGILHDALSVPIALNTDVNAAALAEYRYGAGKGLKSVAYMTVGTGIGIGVVLDGEILSGGLSHSEMGHMQIPLHADDSSRVSGCSYHEHCLEGLASGKALKLRSGGIAAEAITDSQIWDIEAYYIALAIVNIITMIMPQQIVIGGGVMNHPGLLDAVRVYVQNILNGYLNFHEITDKIEDYIMPPKLGDLSGLTGALALATHLA